MVTAKKNIIFWLLLITPLCMVYGLLQAVSFHRLVSFPFAQYALSGMFDALFFVGLSFLLWQVMKYGNFKALNFRQRFWSYFAVGFLILAVWNGLSFIALYFIMGSEQIPKILNVLPTKIILGSLIYSLIVMFFNILLENLKTTETINEEPEEAEEISDKTELEEIEKLERIVVKTGQKLNVITIPEIVYFQAEGDYVRIVADTGRFLKENTIKFFQARLPETEFVRVHRSYLVNISKILRIELYGKQNHQLSLNNGDKLKISASGYKRLREVLGL